MLGDSDIDMNRATGHTLKDVQNLSRKWFQVIVMCDV
jgi:hypothetical protein